VGRGEVDAGSGQSLVPAESRRPQISVRIHVVADEAPARIFLKTQTMHLPCPPMTARGLHKRLAASTAAGLQLPLSQEATTPDRELTAQKSDTA